MNRHHSNGFSLLELLTVLAIVTLIISLTLPNLNNTYKRYLLKSLSRDVAGALQQTRLKAISSGEKQSWLVSLDSKEYWHGNESHKHSLPNSTMVEVTTASGEVVSSKVVAISFFPDGTSTGGQVKLVRDGMVFYVQVDWLLGTVKIYA